MTRMIAVQDMIADIREHLIDGDMIAGGDVDCNDILNKLEDITSILTEEVYDDEEIRMDMEH